MYRTRAIAWFFYPCPIHGSIMCASFAGSQRRRSACRHEARELVDVLEVAREMAIRGSQQAASEADGAEDRRVLGVQPVDHVFDFRQARALALRHADDEEAVGMAGLGRRAGEELEHFLA